MKGSFTYDWNSWLTHPDGIVVDDRHNTSIETNIKTYHPTGSRIEAIITWMNKCADLHRWDRRPPDFKIFDRTIDCNMDVVRFKRVVEEGELSNLYGHSWTDMSFWEELNDYFMYMANQLNPLIYEYNFNIVDNRVVSYYTASVITKLDKGKYNTSNGTINLYDIGFLEPATILYSKLRRTDLAYNIVNYNPISTPIIFPERQYRENLNIWTVYGGAGNFEYSSLRDTSANISVISNNYPNVPFFGGVWYGSLFSINVSPVALDRFSINSIQAGHKKYADCFDFGIGDGTLFNRFGFPCEEENLYFRNNTYTADRTAVQIFTEMLAKRQSGSCAVSASSFGEGDCSIGNFSSINFPEIQAGQTLFTANESNTQGNFSSFLNYRCTTEKPVLRLTRMSPNYNENIDKSAISNSIISHIESSTGKLITSTSFTEEELINCLNSWTNAYNFGFTTTLNDDSTLEENKFFVISQLGELHLTRHYGKNDLYI